MTAFFRLDRRSLAGGLVAATAAAVWACGGAPPLTPHAADKILQAKFDDDRLVYSIDDGLDVPAGFSFRTFPDDSPVGRLIQARFITRVDVPDEIWSVAGDYVGGMGLCFRVHLSVKTDHPASMKGTYLVERRTSCPDAAGPSRQTGTLEGSYNPNALTWRVQFSPALHGTARAGALHVGVDRDRRLHWDGQAGEEAAPLLSLVSERPTRAITVTKYRYAVSKNLGTARETPGKIAVGRYVIDVIEHIEPADGGSAARGPFAWHVTANEIGEALAPALSVKGKGEAVFERHGSTWSVKDFNLGR